MCFNTNVLRSCFSMQFIFKDEKSLREIHILNDLYAYKWVDSYTVKTSPIQNSKRPYS